MNIEPLEQEIQQRLPSPQGVALAIMEACRREEVTANEVASLVQTDPALTGRLLAQANSAAMGARPVVSVPQAVSRMGLLAVRQLALSFSLLDQYSQGMCAGFDYPGFWSHSLLIGLAMREIGPLCELGAADELFSCGLLARVGNLALATAYPDEYTKLLLTGAQGPQLLALEQQLLQTDHLHMSVSMLTQWGLPAAMVKPMLFHEDPTLSEAANGSRPRQFAQVLHLSLRLADFLVAPQGEQAYRISELTVLASKFGISADELAMHVDALTAQWQLWGKTLKVPAHEVPSFSQMAQAALRPDQDPDTMWLRVLIVEDDHFMRELLEVWLKEECRHSVMTVRNGQEALALALDFKPHVVLTGWSMPVMNGLELCQALRSSDWGQAIYVLMVTDKGSQNELIDAFDAGVDDYLIKPVNVRALRARLNAAWRFVRLRDAWERDHQRLTRTAAELALSNRRLQYEALSDSLTELANRRAGLIALSQAWSAATRYGHPLCVISLDIDHFKTINDRHGHAVGDSVLQSISKGLRAAARREDTVCRWGGEEFVVISPNMVLREAQLAAERLRKYIAALDIMVAGQLIKVTISLGVASWEREMADPERLLAAADKALYIAKSAGRNRIVISSQGQLRIVNAD